MFSAAEGAGVYVVRRANETARLYGKLFSVLGLLAGDRNGREMLETYCSRTLSRAKKRGQRCVRLWRI